MTDAILLKIVLIRNQMSAVDLCKKCGFTPSYFYKCLRGAQDFRTDEVRAICNCLNINNDEMLNIFFRNERAETATEENEGTETEDA